MNVLHLIKTPVGATWAFRMIEQTQRLGVRNSVFLPVGSGEMAERYARIGVSVTDSGVPSSIKGIGYWMKGLRALLQCKPPDLIHSHFFITTVASRYCMRNGPTIPRLFQIPGPLHLEHALPRWWDRWSAGREDYYIATCKYTRDLLVGSLSVPPRKVFLSYYGTDVTQYHPDRKGILRNMVNAGSRKIIGMVAWMYPPKRYLGHRTGLKGHEVFLEALPLILKEFPSCVPVIIGGQWGAGDAYERKLKAYAKTLCRESVRFLGPRNDVADLYPDFDVAVHPSFSENVGGVVESLLCGVPTVATTVGGFPDVIIEGETGGLVPPGDSRALAEKILHLLRNPVEATGMAARGRSLVTRLFDVKKTSREVVDIYGQVMGRFREVHRGTA